jgi:hypothetical protein
MPTALVDNELFIDFDNSEVACDSEGNTLSASQYNFFKNSKCLDEYGDIFLVYRATNHDYDTFDISKLGTGAGSIFGKGIYFSADKDSVKIYGNTIKEYYLNLTNPFIFIAMDDMSDALYNLNNFIQVLEKNNFLVNESLYQVLKEDLIENEGGLDTLIELTCGSDVATAYFKNCGFNGIVNLDVLDFVAYELNQIKLRNNLKPTAAVSTAA